MAESVSTALTTEDRDLLACLPPVVTDLVGDSDEEADYVIRTLREPNLARLSILPMYPTAEEPSTQHLLLSNVPSKRPALNHMRVSAFGRC